MESCIVGRFTLMNIMWQQYKIDFTAHALQAGKSQRYIQACLDYAYPLVQKKLPIIFDGEHLSQLVGYHFSYVYSAANAPHHFYRIFTIKKKDGGDRQISAPLPSLKEIQRWILDNILLKISCSKYAKAYQKRSSILKNAKFHKNQRLVLRLDIEHFFPSIKFPKIYDCFRKAGYSRAVSGLLSKLCLLEDSLPQGAPTSPALSNIIMEEIDARIGGFISKNNIRYTRYADDMTFSGDFVPGDVISMISKILSEYGFVLNTKKTKSMYGHKKQSVTGLTVNKKISANAELLQKIRQCAYYIERYGLQSHLHKVKNTSPNYIDRLIGLATFAQSINKQDKNLAWALKVFRESKVRKM